MREGENKRVLEEGCSENLRVFPGLEVGERCKMCSGDSRRGLSLFMVGNPGKPRPEKAPCLPWVSALVIGAGCCCKPPVASKGIYLLSVDCKILHVSGIVWPRFPSTK